MTSKASAMILALAAVTVAVGCQTRPDTPSGTVATSAARYTLQARGGAVEPPDPDAPKNNATLSQSPVRWAKKTAPHRRPRRPGEAPYPGQGDMGAWVWPISQTVDVGIYGGGTYSASMSLPSTTYANGVWLYTPTIYPADSSPLETQMVYYRAANSSTTEKWLGIWDHNQTQYNNGRGTWLYTLYPTDPDWSKYVYNNMWYTEIMKYGNTWYAYLYNWNTGNWDLRHQRVHGGHVADTAGWHMFESWYWGNASSGRCPSTTGYYPNTKSLNIQVYKAGVGWSALTNSVNSTVKGADSSLPCGQFDLLWSKGMPNLSEWEMRYL